MVYSNRMESIDANGHTSSSDCTPYCASEAAGPLPIEKPSTCTFSALNVPVTQWRTSAASSRMERAEGVPM